MAVTEIQYQQVRDYIQKYVAGPIGGISYEGYKESVGKVKRVKPEPKVNSRFKEFWDAYPTSANFIINGMRFTAGRVLRSNYQICEMLYDKAISEGISHGSMVAAIQKQVEILKKESYDTGVNKMAYLSAIEPYLRQRKYEAFMDIEEDNTNQYVNCG